MGTGHVGLHPGLVDKDQTLWINLVLVLFPLLTPARHIGSVLLAGVQAFLRNIRLDGVRWHSGQGKSE